jgi:hypothetical protein
MEKLKNITIPSSPTVAHGHSGSLDRSPARAAQIPAFGRPMPSGARLAHGWHVVTAWCASNACGTVQRSPVFQWLIGDEVLTYTFYN